MSNVIKFSEIQQFRNVLRNVQHAAQFVKLDESGEPVMNRNAICPKLQYEGTVKLHGSNLSIRIEGDNVICQSRNNVIDVNNDCYGFAKFIAALPPEVIQTFKSLFGDNVVIYGEWAGSSIQAIVALNKLPKFWSIFRVQNITDDEEKSSWIDLTNVDLIPLNKYSIYSIRQFGVWNIEIDFEHPADSINQMNHWVMEVEKECPCGKYFGVSGVGEGIVFCCKEEKFKRSKYIFKCKGSEHSKSKVKTLAAVDTVKLKSIEDFIERYVSNERCQQAYDFLSTLNKPIDEKLTADFLRWIVNDINKEEADTIVANGLTPKELNGHISKAARIWYFNKLNKDVGI